LQRLGKVSNVTPSRNMVVKTENPPKIGFEVVDDKLNVIGSIFDIVGPVSAPYAIVKSIVGEPEKLVNRPVYLLLSKTKRSKR
jgi:RNA-binding protein